MRMSGGRRVQVSFPSANVGEHKVKLEKRGTLPTEAHGTVRVQGAHGRQGQATGTARPDSRVLRSFRRESNREIPNHQEARLLQARW